MSEENTTQTQANEVKQPSTEASKNNVSDGNIPQSRFNEVNTQKNEYKTQNQDLQSQLDKVKAEQETARTKKLEQDGQYKKLLDEANAKLEKQDTKLNESDQYFANKTKSLMEQITEDTDKSIAESLPFEKLELFVSKVNKVNSLPTNTNRAASNQPVGDMGGYSSYAEWASKDPDGYQKENNSIKGSGIKIGYGG